MQRRPQTGMGARGEDGSDGFMPQESCDYRSLLRALLFTAVLVFAIQSMSAYAAAVPATQQRIVVLVPGHAEVLAALGLADTLVLVPRDPGLAKVAADADRFLRSPSVEAVLAHRPTLIIGGNPARDQELLDRLASLGLATAMVNRDLPAVDRTSQLAALADGEAAARKLIAQMQTDYRRAQQLAAGNTPVRVLHISSTGAGSSGAVTAAGNNTAANRLIRRVGAINVGAEAGLDRYQSISAEGVIAMAPEAVVVSGLELAALGGRQGIWRQVPGLEHTPAGRHRNLVVLSHAAIKYNAAQSGTGAIALAQALYAR